MGSARNRATKMKSHTTERRLLKPALAGQSGRRPPAAPAVRSKAPPDAREKKRTFLPTLVASGCLSRERGTRGGSFPLVARNRAMEMKSQTTERRLLKPALAGPSPWENGVRRCKHLADEADKGMLHSLWNILIHRLRRSGSLVSLFPPTWGRLKTMRRLHPALLFAQTHHTRALLIRLTNRKRLPFATFPAGEGSLLPYFR